MAGRSRELVERVRAILRRYEAEPREKQPAVLRAGGLELDPGRHRVSRGEEEIELTLIEFRLLHALMSAPSHVQTREALIARLYDDEPDVIDRVIDVHVGKLRRKLENDPSLPRLIRTVRGVGYRFAPEDADPDKLSRILRNLLENACRFTPREGRIIISGRHSGDRVRLEVANTGATIPTADLPHIFERFYRVERARSRETGGAGVGKDGVALGGTDPVAYFEVGKPAQGSVDYNHEWRGALWHFANTEHRGMFAKNPEACAPQCGGWCARAAARGDAAKSVPEAWKIVDGKLYLNFNQSIQRRWERNIEEYIAAADEHWPDIF
ncbi:YHS domain-containing (seleno)protein [Aquisalimonas sp.]|uniref:YHS domain-containing (seleno)protein n=1 Tax=Aquisalimonas sp. TaxID=1872621 RepID=UPI0025B853D2|nr:YHS domain-containing (seleno)protein [Aquisalimonas sp.]